MLVIFMALSKKRDWMKASEAADYLHISYITLKKYADKGKINYELTPGGQRIYLISELNRIKGINNDNNDTDAEKYIAFYLRDSQGKQSHIDHQREKLMKYTGREPDYVYSDKASGLSENRKGLKRLLRDAKKGKISTVYITAKDRLTRFGYEYLSELLSEYGCDIVVTDTGATSSSRMTNTQKACTKNSFKTSSAYSHHSAANTTSSAVWSMKECC